MIPVLATARMTLGPFDMTHFEAFQAFAATDRASHVGGPTTDPRDAWQSCMLHCGHWIARGYGGFFATDTATGRPAGRFAIWHPAWLDEPELSWIVYEAFEGRGYAAEGATAVRDWAAGRGLGPLMSLIAGDNLRSIRLAERLGATREGSHTYDSGKSVERWRHPMGDAA